jgi:hypothetical protein
VRPSITQTQPACSPMQAAMFPIMTRIGAAHDANSQQA